MTSTSVSLIQRVCTSADESSWQRFVRLYTPLLYYWAKRTGCEPDIAADLVQEVFIVLIKKLPQFEYNQDGSFRGWLRTVAHNCWRNCQRRRQLPEDNSVRMEDLPDPKNDDEFWQMEYLDRLTKQALALIQADFAPQTWQAFWQTTVQGKAPAESAQLLGISIASVYAARSRVLQRLRQEFSGLIE